MEQLTPDEQTLYFFAFRYALPRQSGALSLVSNIILKRVNEFEDWQLQDMLGEMEANRERNEDINLIKRDVQRFFRDGLREELLERSAKAERYDLKTGRPGVDNKSPMFDKSDFLLILFVAGVVAAILAIFLSSNETTVQTLVAATGTDIDHVWQIEEATNAILQR